LTLTLVARKMDSELLNYMRSKAISGPWPAGERLMVCISASPYGPQLLRRAYTIASETHAEWFAVYVQAASVKDLADSEKGYLSNALNLAEELGARTATLSGNDVAAEIVRFARENNISRIVIGKPLRSPFAAFLRGSPVDDLLRVKMDFDIHLVTPIQEKVAPPPARSASGSLTMHPRYYLITVLMVAVLTGLNFLLETVVSPASLVFDYLVVTIAAALFFGTGPSIFASALSLLVFDFFMTEPRFSFSMLHTSDIVNVVVFLFTSLVVGQLVKTSREQNQLLQLRLGRLALIEEMSKEFLGLPPVEQLMGGFVQQGGEAGLLDLLRTTVLDDISHITMKYVARIIDAPSFVLFKGRGGRLQVWARTDSALDLSSHDMAVAEWTFTHGEMAGAGTQTLPDTVVCFMPMKTADETVGVIGLRYEFKNLLLDQRRLLGVTSTLSALAAARWVKV
jgi:two-component system, OmpR family, sensor histidine kinase KdpD